MSSSCTTLAAMYPTEGRRSEPTPTIDIAIWCLTPAFDSAAKRLVEDVRKISIADCSSKEGAFERSITVSTDVMAPAKPSPVMVCTPVDGEAARTS